MCSTQNYDVLAGIKTDLYKGFLPLVWYIANDNGISGLLHPEGVYDDAKGGELRSNIYSRLISHFQFHNQKNCFRLVIQDLTELIFMVRKRKFHLKQFII